MPSVSFTRRQALVGLAVAALLVLALSQLRGPGGGGGGAPSAVSTSAIPALSAPEATTGPSELVVDVAGAVRRPGLYRLPHGTRVADAIARAGGTTRHAAADLVNLAAPLADGEQVLVPAGDVADVAGASPGSSAAAGPVDLNSATVEQLDALPGIGPVTAQKIVDYRNANGPYRSAADLDAISGIGASRIDALKGLVVPA